MMRRKREDGEEVRPVSLLLSEGGYSQTQSRREIEETERHSANESCNTGACR